MNPATLRRIAFAVFRESVRDRVPYSLVGFALLVMGASYLIGQITAGQDVKIIKDLGLAAMSLVGLFIAIFIGIGLVSKELERRSVYSLIAKPVRRSELIVGKYAGLVLTIAINLAVMTVVWYLVLGYMSWMETEAFKKSWEASATDPRMLVAVYLIIVQLMLVIAIALFFSTFAEPLWAAVFTLGLYVAGHFSADLKHFDLVVGDSPLRTITSGLYYLLPNMAMFDVKNAVVHAPAGAAGLRGDRDGVRRVLHRGAGRRRRLDLRAAGLQVDRVRTTLLALIVAAGLGSAIALQSARDRWFPQVASPVDEIYFSSGEALGRMALSFKSLLADVYWMRAVQYFGGTRLDVKNGVAPKPGSGRTGYDLLYPLLDVTTTLDPSFNIAYRFGATFLAEGYPNGPGRPDQAVALLEKGFDNNPGKWQYLYDKAFVYYWSMHDYRQAAHWFSEAAKVPGSPAWMPGLAAFMLGAGRRSPQLAVPVAAASRHRRAAVRPRQRGVPPAAARRGRRRGQADGAAQAVRVADRRSPGQLRAADSGGLAALRSRRIPTACRSRWTRRRCARGWIARRSTRRCRTRRVPPPPDAGAHHPSR